jgi:hypothetical protein
MFVSSAAYLVKWFISLSSSICRVLEKCQLYLFGLRKNKISNVKCLLFGIIECQEKKGGKIPGFIKGVRIFKLKKLNQKKFELID